MQPPPPQPQHPMRKVVNSRCATDIVYCDPQLGKRGGLVVLRRLGMSPYWWAVIYPPANTRLETLPRCTADLCTIDVSQRCPDTQLPVVVYWLNGVNDQNYDDAKPIERLYLRVRDFIRRYISPAIPSPPSPSSELSSSTLPASAPPPPNSASTAASTKALKRRVK